MIERFQSDSRLLLEAVMNQQCVAHDVPAAEALCRVLELTQCRQGDVLIRQGTQDNHVFLILAGRVSIAINGREVAIRKAGQHVGEMAAIDPSAVRSATITALEETVFAKVSPASLLKIADERPHVWRRLAMELADRLRERSKYHRAPNPRPVIFIGSSTEGLAVANEIQAGLRHDDVLAEVWTNDVFIPGHGTMQDLEAHVTAADFGVLVCTKDDTVESRQLKSQAPRDNVILELGMCIGAFGSNRSLIVKPRSRDLKIPTDLLGITMIDYTDDDVEHLAANIGPVCLQIRKVVKKLGVR